MDFTNKVVLITGASAGIGEATALLFAEHGAKLVIVGMDKDRLLAVRGKIEQAGCEVLALQTDLSTDSGVEEVAKETLDRFGKLDVLINNAGVTARTTLEATDMATYDRVFNLNVRSVYNLTRLLAPALIATGGNIVNVSSISGSMVAVGSLPYSMGKAALDHFTRLIALELAPKGVRVNAVSPGITVSKIVQRVTGYTDEQYQAWLKESEKIIPMGSVCAAIDVARSILHLASDASALVTGAIMPVDGGLQLAGVGSAAIMKQHVKK